MSETVKILSNAFIVRPKQVMTLSAGGMIKLTPKKEYVAFRTSYEIPNQPGKETIMICKDTYRWFPVNESYAKNNFEYVDKKTCWETFEDFVEDFNNNNEHIRNKEKLILI